jgi:membrane protease YdiL (CAAX protease family)
MLGSILRLAMLAGTGAGMATGFRHAMLKLAALFAAALIVGLMFATAIGTFGVAIYFALTPEFGPAWGAAATGGLLIIIAVVLALICRSVYLRKRRATSASGSGLGGLGGSLGAAALGASMGAGPSFDIKGTLERNAVTVLLAAFIAGMVMNNRR